MSSQNPAASLRREGLKKCEGSGRRNIIGVSQSATQSVEEYKAEFFEKAKSLDMLEEEWLMAKWFRDGLREEIKKKIRMTTLDETMDQIIELAYLVETRLETIPPEESVDKCMVSCEDREKEHAPIDNYAEDPEYDPAEFPVSDDVYASWHGDYSMDSRDWVYDDLDQWGVGTPPH